MAIADAGFRDHGDRTGPEILHITGPTLRVRVGLGGPISEVPDGTVRMPDHGIESDEVLALIDTGARESCIDQALADRLALTLVDRRIVAGVGGRHSFNVYLAKIEIPVLDITENGLFTAVRLTDGGSPHRVILGRSLLRDLVVVYDGRRGIVSVCS